MAIKKKNPAKPVKSAAPAKPETAELSLIRQMAAILNETGLTEIEIDHKGAKLRVAKSVTTYASIAPSQTQQNAAAPALAAATSTQVAAIATAPDSANIVKSPMVGTAYLSAAPGSPQFITIGATVKEGQTVLIIEAMKTMNQIPAPKSGTVTKIIVENGQPVEFGEALLVIE
jgi:acetyl-CoA carboxylase biotin carboxyl carrier protein